MKATLYAENYSLNVVVPKLARELEPEVLVAGAVARVFVVRHGKGKNEKVVLTFEFETKARRK